MSAKRGCWAPSRRVLVVLCLLVVPGVAGPARGDAIDDYLQRERDARQIPGLALAVVRQGRIERVSTYGLANLETDTPVTPDSVFAIASLDKGIIATGVLKAAEVGKLAVEDAITKHVDVPFSSMTLAMLLSHTSGLPDMDEALAEHFGAHIYRRYTTENLLAAVRAARPHAAPGAHYHYSDSGIFLAQLATVKATGQSWWDFMRTALFEPAGMTRVVSLNPRTIVRHRVAVYTFDSEPHLTRSERTDVDYGELYSDLGMTVGDFARWLIMLDGRGPLAPESIRRLWTPSRLADGSYAREVSSFSGYGLGCGLDDVLGEQVILHTGHSGVAYVKFPALDLAVVVFTNLEHSEGSDPAGLALGVAGLLEPKLSLATLPASFGPEPPAAPPLRRDYELFLAGEPDTNRYAAGLRDTVWDHKDTFSNRLPRLGPLVAWQYLHAAPVDGEPSLLFRATHAHGAVYVRFSLDGDGRISRFVWWHL
jgi:CubicO group peptidase (beta-lactamase class C family)